MRSTSTALQDGKVVENVSQTAAVVAQQGSRAMSSLWNMSKKAYVSVASSVETAARDSGYQINLGAKDIERSIGDGQPGGASDVQGYSNGDAHHFTGWGDSAAEQRDGNGYSSGAAHSSNFAGFDDGNGADGACGTSLTAVSRVVHRRGVGHVGCTQSCCSFQAPDWAWHVPWGQPGWVQGGVERGGQVGTGRGGSRPW